MKETHNAICVFEYCDSNTWYVAGPSNSLKNTCLFSLFVTALKWLHFVIQGSVFVNLALIVAGELLTSSLCLLS